MIEASISFRFSFASSILPTAHVARTGCHYEIKFEPKPRWSGELQCPSCGRVFKVSRIDNFVGRARNELCRSGSNSQ